MARQNHTRESLIQTLQNIASQLGTKVLSKRDVATHISLSAVNYRFGNLGNALKAAGLAANAPGPPDGKPHNLLTDDDLFISLLEVEKQIGHDPSLSVYRANSGTLSSKPVRTRFGKWDATLQHYRKWKADRGITAATPIETQLEHGVRDAQCARQSALSTTEQPQNETWRFRKPPQLFGQPIDFRGLRHAPINEQGVVYLFGMVSRELGFSVEALQQGFPDCEGKYLHDKNRELWAKARIEFEFRASNFREHGHDENECDVIVCWENDWPDCPLRVVELKSEIMRLPSR
jgi:hypothetical protein